MVQVLDDRASDRQSVLRRGAASHLVEDYQRSPLCLGALTRTTEFDCYNPFSGDAFSVRSMLKYFIMMLFCMLGFHS